LTVLNQDIHVAVDQHVIYTASLPESDERKFSTSCPHREPQLIFAFGIQERTVAPSSERIVQDRYKMILAMKRIWDVRESLLKVLNRTGKRFFQSRAEQQGPRHRDPTKDKTQ
jgi:hypothetical protein